jgi:IPT/TIG domain
MGGALVAVVLMAPALGFLAASPAAAASVTPVVTGVTPSYGLTVVSNKASATTPGGTAVTISGANFTGATVVAFGGVPATGIHVVSDSTITATSPTISNSIGNTVDVTVTTPQGTSAPSVADEFTYPYNYTSAGAVTESTITLAASAQSIAVHGSVTLTATAPTDVGPSDDFGLSIVDVTNAAAPVAVAHIPAGTTVSTSVSEAAAQTNRYVAAYDACTVYPSPCPPGALEIPLANDGGVSIPVNVTWTASAPPATGGYTLVASDGGIFTFGAPYYGSTGAMPLNAPIVGMAADPSTGGYWLVASDGGIFSFNAPYYGSTGAMHLNKPIVGMAADPATGGYWLVASDGGIFSFNAPFQGSTGAMTLNKPIVGMAADAATGGYWLVASDGGIFSFNAPFDGSTGGMPLNKPIVGMAANPLKG